MSSLQEIRENRLKKLKLLQDKGINPYPVSTRLDATLKAATKDFAKLSKKKEISIAGRVMALRGQGGLVFADLFDGTSKFQVLLKRDELSSDLFNLWSDTVDIGDVVELCGKLFLTKRSEKTLQVKKGETFTQKDIKRLIVHEIGVHTTRYVNGERQSYKLFVYGTAGYDETEEGLAVWNEELNQVLSRNALRNYAGRVLAIHWALQYSFSETYQKLCKYFGEQEAYHLTLRVKRGLKDTSQPGAYTKDSIYLVLKFTCDS